MSDIIVPQSDVKLCTRNVNLYYGENHALKDINLDIKTNKITAFIGPSGCGKSTYLKSLNRMNDLIPDCKITGRFLLDGEDIYADGVDTNVLRRRIGMVFQKPNPFPMSIYDNIAEVILMDEPTSALDPVSTLKIEELMNTLKEKYTVAIVTHNMQQATRISDYTAFFLVGEMVEYAPTEELFSRPVDKRTEDYITGRFG